MKAISFSRNFAVVIDSDRSKSGARLNLTKKRVEAEVENQGGFCWITEGREIENYLCPDLIKLLSEKFKAVKMPRNKYTKILDAAKVNKVDFARKAIENEITEWPLDLKKNVRKLVKLILAAR